ncbi:MULTISPECIES: cytochrome c oxidase subunit II [unclassified Mesorhizobium]|uniref:cytochrome c oxidase subunit II n=1 Tax=unclassified Mesorhizobium TaxID=325217 RepID=UPI001FEF3D30|nr:MULTISPECIES: cytochrome c oxidase subunit II [unclassified Mesorhizobium]
MAEKSRPSLPSILLQRFALSPWHPWGFHMARCTGPSIRLRQRRQWPIASAFARPARSTSGSRLPGVLRWLGLASTVVSAPVLSGCSGWQSALHAHGANARAILDLIWSFGAVAAITWVLVMLALAMALLHHRGAQAASPPLGIDSHQERRFGRAVGSAVAATVLVLAALTITSFFAGKSIASMSGKETLTVRITGHQWWWEIRYPKDDRSRMMVTANEIHVPVGEPVKVELDSTDVIHSFWVPSLAGKRDLIPGRPSEITLIADRPGIYRGQCAEFCGYQHAHMAVTVIAESREAFEAWRSRQDAAAIAPASEEERRGQRAFLSTGCALCHTLRGTPAKGAVGPDLTHLANRRALAADTLAMTPGALAAWIADPQSIKPGAKMPRIALSADDLRAVVAYLGSLE